MKNVHLMSRASADYNDSMLPLYMTGFHMEDNSYFSERRWLVRAGPAELPLSIEIVLRVNWKHQRDGVLSKLGSMTSNEPHAFIVSNERRGDSVQEQQLFPSAQHPSFRECEDGGVLDCDVTHRWLLYGPADFCSEKNFYEAQPGYASGPWFLATILKQLPGGIFEAVLTLPGPGGVREVTVPGLTPEQLREAKSKKPLEVPRERELRLHVPCRDPLQASLRISGAEGLESCWSHLAIFSPSPTRVGETLQPFLRTVDLQVSKDRHRVRASVGGSHLKLFLTDEVRAVTRDPYGELCLWTLRVGPLTEHTIEVERWGEQSRTILLKVDGEPIVTCSAKNLQRQDQDYSLKFVIYRATCTIYHVYETNRAGDRLDSTGSVKEKRPFFHHCEVRIPQRGDIRGSKLLVDGRDFAELPRYVKSYGQEASIVVDAETLRTQFGLLIPHKVNQSAPSGWTAVAHSVGKHAAPSYLDHLVGCCHRIEHNEEITCFPTHKVIDEYSHYGMYDIQNPYAYSGGHQQDYFDSYINHV